MVIIVTGKIGIGKTTVCRELAAIVRSQGYTCGGVLSYEASDGDILIEDIQTGKKETLASPSNVYQGPRTPKYYFNPEGIEFGIQAIEQGLSTAILIVDEIGHLELRSEGFAGVLELIRTNKVKDCILVIRCGLLPEFLPRLATVPLIFETTSANRDQLPQKIGSVLLENLQNEDSIRALGCQVDMKYPFEETQRLDP